MREMTREQVVVLIRRGVRDAGSYRAYGARVGLESSWVSQLVRGRGSFGAHALRQLGLVDVRIVEQVEDAPVQSVQRMTREQVVVLIRRRVAECGTLRAYCVRQGVHISTMSNMLGGRNRFTPRVLRLLGLDHVRIVARVDGAAVEPVPDAPGRPYRKMWRLGDWPSRYRVAGEL